MKTYLAADVNLLGGAAEVQNNQLLGRAAGLVPIVRSMAKS
jgi:hypothetical protein